MIDWSYIAGLFDGDGSVTLGKSKSTNSLVYFVCISSSDTEFLQQLKKWFNKQHVKAIVTNPKSSTPQLQIHSTKSIRTFIERTIDKSIIKKQRLKIMLDVLNLKEELKNKGLLINQNFHLFDKKRRELHALAKKGPKTLVPW